jgi:predicted DsbA family dithiol-disulfide isomerase
MEVSMTPEQAAAIGMEGDEFAEYLQSREQRLRVRERNWA